MRVFVYLHYIVQPEHGSQSLFWMQEAKIESFNCEHALLYLWVSAVYTVTTYTSHPSVVYPYSEYQVAQFFLKHTTAFMILKRLGVINTAGLIASFHRLWHVWCPEYWITITYSQNQVPYGALFFIFSLIENTSPNQWHWEASFPQVSCSSTSCSKESPRSINKPLTLLLLLTSKP